MNNKFSDMTDEQIVKELEIIDKRYVTLDHSERVALSAAAKEIKCLDSIAKEILSTAKYYRKNVNTDKADGMMFALQIMNKYRGEE